MLGVIEQMRDNHEDIENLEQAAVDCLLAKSRKELGVNSDFCVDFIASEIHRKATELVRNYADPDGVRNDDIQYMGGNGSHDVWHAFYNRVAEVKDFTSREVNRNSISAQSSIETWRNAAIASAKLRMSEFTGEENNGRYVDLNSEHQTFLNLRKYQDYLLKQYVQTNWSKYIRNHPDMDSEQASGVFKDFSLAKSATYKPLDYVSWLKHFSDFEGIPRYFKYRQNDYMKYLDDLSAYLHGFMKRQRPLYDLDSRIDLFKSEFEKNWIERNVTGWKEYSHEMSTYSIPTDKLFSNERAMAGHLTSKEYVKASAKQSGVDRDQSIEKSVEIDKGVALQESLISLFRDMLSDTIEDSIDHVTRKQARTAFEIERDLAVMYGSILPEEQPDDDNASIASSSGGEEVDVNDRAIYNPLNLPLGWDGKPIPFWMYKLHGLGHEFKCEICGNCSYWGRRAFEIHFNEWKHVNALKALRIPNSSHFYGITGIEDAILLNTKLRKEATAAIFNADKEMECEDALGNVMSYRAYQDLVRQGLA